MKKLIALILCVSMLTGMLPAASLADTLLYEYPQVNAYLTPSDMEALEYEFRQWAAKAVEAYIFETKTNSENNDYYNSLGFAGFNGPLSVIEYYRMADTKIQFDRDKGEIEENIYNNYEMNDSEMQGMYLWVFLESIKEKMYANNFALLKQYGNIEEDEKRYWMVDVETGGLKKDNLAQQAQNASDDVANSKWAKVASNFVTALVETVADYFVVTNGADGDLMDLIDGIGGIINSGAKGAIDACKINALNEVDNAVRNELQKDLSEAVNNVSDAMLAYLKESYINTENEFLNKDLFGAEYYTDLIKNFIDNVESNRSKYQADLDAEVQKYLAEETSKEIFDSIGYDILDIFTADEIAMIAGINAIMTMIEKSLNFAWKKVKDKLVGSFTIPIPKMGMLTFQYSDVIDAVKSVSISQAKKGVEEYLSEIQSKVRNGEELSDNMLIGAFNKAMGKIYSLEYVKNLVVKLGALAATETLRPLVSPDDVGEAILDFLETQFDIFGENKIKGEDMDGKDVEKLIKGILKVGGKVSERDLNEINNTIQATYTEQMEIREYGNYYFPNTDDEIIEYITDREGELVQIQEELEEKAQRLSDKVKALDIVLNVVDSWWEVGASIRTALESSASASSGEGIMSMLGMRMVSCRNMSSAIKVNLASTYLSKYAALYNSGVAQLEATIMNPDETPLEELYSIISQLYITNQYDVVGASAYLDMVLHKDIFYDDWDWFSAKFARYISDYHINKQGSKGLLPYDAAVNEYNYYVSLNEKYEMDEKWSVLFQ